MSDEKMTTGSDGQHSPEELDAWTDQALDASSLEEMFGADLGAG